MGFIILAIAGVVVAATLIYAATRPGTMRFERSTVINAPAEKIFAILNDFRQWGLWSPYEKKDPDMKRDFSGPATGVGSVYDWNGDKNIGEGRLTIIESTPYSHILLTIAFVRPGKFTNTIEFTLTPEPTGGTKFTWAMYGACPFMFKLMGVFFNMEKMMDADFQAGLRDLKAATEK